MIRWTDQEWRHWFDLHAYCRVMREQAPPGWETTPDGDYNGAHDDNKDPLQGHDSGQHATGSAVRKHDERPERVLPSSQVPRAKKHVALHDSPNPNFWPSLAAERDAAMGEWVEPGEHDRHKGTLRQVWMMCEECGRRYLRSMAAPKAGPHKQRQAAAFIARHPEITGYDALLAEYGYVQVSA